MVSISKKRMQPRRRRGGGGGGPLTSDSVTSSEKWAAAGLFCLFGCGLAYAMFALLVIGDGDGQDGGGGGESRGTLKRRPLEDYDESHPNLHFQGPNSESYNAIALDIIQFLNCRQLLNRTTTEMEGGGGGDQEEFGQQQFGGDAPGQQRQAAGAAAAAGGDGREEKEEEGHFRRRRRRRLQGGGEADGGGVGGGIGEGQQQMMLDDFALESEEGMWDYKITPTAAHLFCVAAMYSERDASGTVADAQFRDKVSDWKERINCGKSTTSSAENRAAVLDIWSSARSEIQQDDILRKTLEASTEHDRDLAGKRLSLWAPTNDDGLDYMVNVLNEEQKSVDHGGVYGLETNLGAGKTFVDVGSCLGLTSFAVTLLYPGTKIVSLEAASPNWLLQQANWQCNAEALGTGSGSDRTVLLSGVGPSTMTQMAKVMWRPSATTSTRSWTPATEKQYGDMELAIKLRPWHSILAEARVDGTKIDVLNVDCEGCEYNLVPSLSDTEWDAIPTVMGSLHWGYIPKQKLPSSSRARQTHERLCQHENFARTAKECCAFPDMAVKSSIPGEVLVKDSEQFPPKASTVADVSELCDDFDEWAKSHHLNDIESDWGWFQISSMSS